MKRYLVLGGNGFLGRYIVDRLSIDNKVIVADYNIENSNTNSNVTYKKLNFIDCNDFSEYLEDVDVVIHLISTIIANDNVSNIKKDINDNVFPTIKLLDSMAENNVRSIFFVSSGGTVYGEHDNSPIKESEPINPICNYGIIKSTIENYLNLYNIYYGINYKIVRLANPYSDITKTGKKQGIISIAIDNILEGKQIVIWGDGNDVRDYIYIEDAIDAIVKVINYNGLEKVFNIGTGIGYSINDILNIIKDKLNLQYIDVDYQKPRYCDVKNNILDITKIKSELNWEPKVELHDGIQRVLDIKRRRI